MPVVKFNDKTRVTLKITGAEAPDDFDFEVLAVEVLWLDNWVPMLEHEIDIFCENNYPEIAFLAMSYPD